MAQGNLIKQLLENRDALLGFIFALTRDFDGSEEIFQNVAMAIVEEDRKATNVAKFMPWAREIARRRVADFYKNRARRSAVEQPSDSLAEVISQSFAENDATLEAHQARMQALLECSKKLSGRNRELIEGFYGRRMSLRDLASSLNWRENSVKVALCRARKALGECINGRLRLLEVG